MNSEKKKKKKELKNSQLLIRINQEERDEFVELCENLDTSAAREIRHFIRNFIKKEYKQCASTASAPAS